MLAWLNQLSTNKKNQRPNLFKWASTLKAKQKVLHMNTYKISKYLLFIATLTQIDTGAQCNLLDVPPLQKLPPVTSLDDSIATETKTDLDTSFCTNQEDYTTE